MENVPSLRPPQVRMLLVLMHRAARDARHNAHTKEWVDQLMKTTQVVRLMLRIIAIKVFWVVKAVCIKIDKSFGGQTLLRHVRLLPDASVRAATR